MGSPPRQGSDPVPFELPQLDMSSLVESPESVLAIALWFGAALGLTLWLAGRRLSRPVITIGGLLLAAVAAMAFTGQWPPTPLQALAIGASGLAGALVAFLLFRIWMGVTAAAVLGLAAPLAMLIWLGTGLPPGPWDAADPEDTTAPPTAQVDPEDTTAPPTAQVDPEDTTAPPTAQVGPEEAPPGDEPAGESIKSLALAAQVKSFVARQRAAAEAWWQDDVGSALQQTAMVIAAGGALLGLVAGLVFPRMTAAAQSAFVGALLLMGCGCCLLRDVSWTGGISLPGAPRPFLITLGLITAAGITLQWMIFRRRADT